MDWTEFREKLGKIQIPAGDNGYIEKFITADNSIHLSFSKWDESTYTNILKCISVLEKRGAIREKDYIITSDFRIIDNGENYEVDNITIHTTTAFLSQEDF